MKIILVIFTTAVITVMCILGVAIYSSNQNELEMAQQHCVKSGNERTSFYIQQTYDSKGMVNGFYPVYITEYEYKCDDGKRWY